MILQQVGGVAQEPPDVVSDRNVSNVSQINAEVEPMQGGLVRYANGSVGWHFDRKINVVSPKAQCGCCIQVTLIKDQELAFCCLELVLSYAKGPPKQEASVRPKMTTQSRIVKLLPIQNQP